MKGGRTNDVNFPSPSMCNLCRIRFARVGDSHLDAIVIVHLWDTSNAPHLKFSVMRQLQSHSLQFVNASFQLALAGCTVRDDANLGYDFITQVGPSLQCHADYILSAFLPDVKEAVRVSRFGKLHAVDVTSDALVCPRLERHAGRSSATWVNVEIGSIPPQNNVAMQLHDTSYTLVGREAAEITTYNECSVTQIHIGKVTHRVSCWQP